MVDNDQIISLPPIESIRKRPGMYIGDPGFMGLIHYLVEGLELLYLGSEDVHVTIAEEAITFEGSFALGQPTDKGIPYIEVLDRNVDQAVMPVIITALSRFLELHYFAPDGSGYRARWESGERVLLEPNPERGNDRVILTFAPDPEFFSVTSLEPSVLRSYLRRQSYLQPTRRLHLTIGSDTVTFHNPEGVKAMLLDAAAPYQLLHEPICLSGEKDECEVKLAFAFHSSKGDCIWSFVSRGMVPDGGTHVDGLCEALEKVQEDLGVECELPVLAVLQIRSPDIRFSGCVRNKIVTDAFRTLVPEIVLAELADWCRSHPEAWERLKLVRTHPGAV